MTFVLSALILFALAAFVGTSTYDDYRVGKMQLVMKGISPRFDRIEDAPFFWGATAINVAMTLLFAGSGVLMLFGLVLR